MEGAESVEEEIATKDAVPEYCLVFAETALQLMTRGARKEVGNTIQLVSDVNFNAGKPHRRVKEVDDCKRILKDSRGWQRSWKELHKEFCKR